MKTLISVLIIFVVGLFVGSRLIPSQQTEIKSEANPKASTSNNASSPLGEATALNPEESATIRLFEQAAPSVVFITTSKVQRDYYSANIYEIPQGSGTGFIWDEKGHIVTNFHVIESSLQKGSKVTVTLNNKTSYPAKIVGVAPNKDLALLKIEATYDYLKPIPLGRSYNLKVGQSTYAIGNPFGLDQSLTTGVVSALGREIKTEDGTPMSNVIQTDAAINPGNSGGPLLDSSGRLIGVNTAIYSPSGAYAGIGFSIPVDEVAWVIPDLIQYGRIKRPYLGVELLSPQQYSDKGAMIARIAQNGPAAKAGLKGFRSDEYGRTVYGDVILKIGNFPIATSGDITPALEKLQVGERVIVEFVRQGQRLKTELTLGSSVNE